MAGFLRNQAWTPRAATPWIAGWEDLLGISTVNFERIKAAYFSKTKNKLLLVYWLACWEIPEIRPTEVDESDPFPLAMGDGTHVVKKRAERHTDSEVKLQCDSGGMTVKQTNTRRSANPSIAVGLQTFHLLQICGYSQEYQSHAESDGNSRHLEKKILWSWQRGVKVDRWFAVL